MQGFPWWFHIKNHLPIQDTCIQSLVQEDATSHEATRPVHHNYEACVLEPES